MTEFRLPTGLVPPVPIQIWLSARESDILCNDLGGAFDGVASIAPLHGVREVVEVRPSRVIRFVIASVEVLRLNFLAIC